MVINAVNVFVNSFGGSSGDPLSGIALKKCTSSEVKYPPLYKT